MTVVFAILMFSILILVHELGHFVAAKLSGVQVNEFSMFMGPAIFQKKFGNTLYSLRCIPLGGYCAMEGEDGDSDDPHAFASAKVWKRLIILVAGAFMNFVIGVLIMVFLYMPAKELGTPVIESFESYSTINGETGLQVGDRLLKIDGENIYVSSDISTLLSLNPSDTHDVVVRRNGQKVVLNQLKMERHPVTDEQGNTHMLYGMNFAVQKATFGAKLSQAWGASLNAVRSTRLSLQMLFTGKAGLMDLSGPVGIVQMMSETAESSENTTAAFQNMMYFAAIIAVNLAVMNLLPIPALDGGRVVALLLTASIEAITKKKINPKIEGYIHGVGMIILLGLMAVVMFKDIFVIFKG